MLTIYQSVDSLCRNGADAQYNNTQKSYNFTTNMLIAYLSTIALTLKLLFKKFDITCSV